MKITKTIEVEVCDSCGAEARYGIVKCSLCLRQCCTRCSDLIHTFVERVSPGPGRSTLNATIYTKYNGSYCAECTQRVIRILREFQMIEGEERKYGA